MLRKYGRDRAQTTGHLPIWLRRPSGSAAETVTVKRGLRRAKLHTVCEEARCPNIAECFGAGTATFLILGNVCTRNCGFCSVANGRPMMGPDQFAEEAEQVAAAAAQLGLKHVVITSVTRDDLEDGGASGFCLVVEALRRRMGCVRVELLVPDFGGNERALEQVLHSGPDVLNHNLETVPRMYPRVRGDADYERSLKLLGRVKELSPSMITKTGILLGLGERKDEVVDLMKDARACGVDIFTAGQYLQPTRKHLPVNEYLPLETFDYYRMQAELLGFRNVFIGPLVRSSYHAENTFA